MAMMMIGRARHTSPTPPGMNSNGTKATTDVRTAKVRGTLIRRAPRIAAATPGVPRLRSYWMCSATTMASSTTIPMARTKENRLMVLIATSRAIMTARAPIPETARPTATHRASRIWRKRLRAISTSSRPRIPFLRSRSARSS